MQDKFLEVYSYCRNEVWLVAYSRCYNFETANDLTQEAFLRYWRELTLGNIVSYERSWLCRVVRNLAEDYCKSSFYKNGTVSPELLEKIDSHVLSPGAVFEKEELITNINLKLSELDSKDRQILEMRYNQDCRIVEIARELGVNSAAAKMRLFRARTRLAHYLKNIACHFN